MTEEKVHNPHDKLFKATLDSPQGIQDFFKVHCPQEIRNQLDLESIVLSSKSFVKPELREYHSDLVFECTIGGKMGYFYALIEHQSSADNLMHLRLMTYNIALIEHFLKGKPKDTPWPVILNCCFYHGLESPYPYPLDLYERFSSPKLASELGMFRQFHLIDLTAIPDQELEKHASIALMEKLLKYSRSKTIDLFAKFEELFNILGDDFLLLLSDPMVLGQDYWRTIILYLLEFVDEEKHSQEKIINFFTTKLTNKKGEIMSIAQRLRNEGIQQGMQQGIQQGRNEGMQQGIQQGRNEGMQQGIQQEKYVIARNMLSRQLDRSLIAQVTGLSEKALQELQPILHKG